MAKSRHSAAEACAWAIVGNPIAAICRAKQKSARRSWFPPEPMMSSGHRHHGHRVRSLSVDVLNSHTTGTPALADTALARKTFVRTHSRQALAAGSTYLLAGGQADALHYGRYCGSWYGGSRNDSSSLGSSIVGFTGRAITCRPAGR